VAVKTAYSRCGALSTHCTYTPHHGSPQYLFPVRRSVFRALEQRFPLYGEMYDLVKSVSPRPDLPGAESRRWFRTMGDEIKRSIFATP
jgi:hypothetical protein